MAGNKQPSSSQNPSEPALHAAHHTLQALSPEQIYKIYQTYIKELSSRLVELNQEACASEDITAQVEKLTKEVVSGTSNK